MSGEQKEPQTCRGGWQSYHLFYHDDLDEPLIKCVKPVVIQLYRRGWLEKFFFIRYGLGGPHIRLRILPQLKCSTQARDLIQQEVAGFFSQFPSLRPKSDAAILRDNKTLLANDSHERDDGVYPDNSLVEFPFSPETERYGGPLLLGYSLDFFTFSSVAALSVLGDGNMRKKGRRISTLARYLLRLALGFAGNAQEFGHLLGYGVEWNRSAIPEIILLADSLYEGQKDNMRRLIESEIERAAQPATGADETGSTNFWTRVAGRLAMQISTADSPSRQRIFCSHLHMTANRFGLKNTDELYLSRLICRALADTPESARATLFDCFSSRFAHSIRLVPGQASLPQILETAFGFMDLNDELPLPLSGK